MVAGLAARLKAAVLLTAAIAFAAVALAQPPRVALGPPSLANGSVRWAPARLDGPEWLSGLALPPRTTADTLALWTRVAERDSLLRPFALLTIGRMRYRMGEASVADSVFAFGLARPNPWSWSLAQARLESWRVRFGPEQALRLYETLRKDGWNEAEVAASRVFSVRLQLERGDTAQARSTARTVMKTAPSTAAARTALGMLDRLVRAPRDSLTRQDEWDAAQIDRFAGERESAEKRLTRALRMPEVPAAESSVVALATPRRHTVALRLAEFRRLLRRDADAEKAIAIALASAANANERAAALTERARTLQQRGLLDSALTTYRRAADTADSTASEPLILELARELERAGRWSAAREALLRVATGRRRESAADAAFRVGLMHFVEGRTDSAVAWWEGRGSEAATFWHATGLRAMARGRTDTTSRALTSRADAELRSLGVRPGYSFYRAAARETLGLRGWSPQPVLAARSMPRAVESARTLAALGMNADATNLLSRFNAADPRVTPAAPSTEDRMAAAQLAYAIGSVPLAIGIADRAARMLDDSTAARAWSAQPWLYPPAFDSLAHLAPAGLEPAMVLAIMRQESRFDPRARSVSDALGLMQLKLSTARDVARRLREKGTLTEEKMFDPARNVRYGAAYYEQLRARFGGSPSVALSAYNAGPGTVPPFTLELLARGGEALFTEIASNATAQDYTRKILTNRAAYREMAPRR